MAPDATRTLDRDGAPRPAADGGLDFAGDALRLFGWLGRRLEDLALETGARPLGVAPTIDRGTLDRADYFAAFPGVAVAAGDDAFLPPAACYHVYRSLGGAPLAAPRMLTLAALCGREEARAADEIGRLRRFHMREVVFVGPPAWVAAERDAWIARGAGFAAALGLAAALEPATDTFFGGGGRGRRLLQQVKRLKFELRMDAGSAGRLAVASFNLHDAFFTRRFHIGPLADGSPAASGCAAFGVERWTLACLAQLGPDRARALVDGGVPRSTMNT